ncbi:MAG: N-formylglutamate amidohydrolase, partial [Bdellovibrionales bacterium]|nr:N-formylglutamate amidohydrolase [Bdellovibrionales bacterium]
LPAGTHPKGLHWSITTHGETLIPEPMSMDLHKELVRDYYEPVHKEITDLRQQIKDAQGEVFHLDLHSMPSLGTDLHPDPGQTRADVVISDQHGRSSKPEFLDIALKAFQYQGFQVAYNWPYIGGGVTKRYGEPEKGFHTLQIELNRNLYMDEATKKPLESEFRETQHRLTNAIENVIHSLKDLIGK